MVGPHENENHHLRPTQADDDATIMTLTAYDVVCHGEWGDCKMQAGSVLVGVDKLMAGLQPGTAMREKMTHMPAGYLPGVLPT